ncbi:MAG: 30S ribosomal protein S20 [bacterium]
MAITRGAKKAHRQSLRKKSMNIGRKLAMRAGIKGVRAVKEAGTGAGKEGVVALATAYKAIDKALKRGVIKKNTAARRKASVAKMLKVSK